MSRTMQVAGVMAAGYFLGRFRKLRLAVLVGSAVANKKIRDSSVGLIQQQAGKLTGSPEMGKLKQQLSQELFKSGKSAALAVAARRMDSVSARLDEQSQQLRSRGNGGSDEADERSEHEGRETEDDGQEPQDSAEVQESEEDEESEDEADEADEDDEDDGDDEDAEGPEDEYDDQSGSDEGDDEEEDEEDGEDEEERPSRRRRAASGKGEGS